MIGWAGAVVVLTSSVVGAAPSEVSEQIVVVRLPSAQSKAEISHRRGDAVAVLEVTRPPANLLATLAGQTGRFFRGVDRRGVMGDRAVVALELSSDAVEIALRRIDETPAIILTFGPIRNPRHPDHRALFGAIPGLFEPGRLPLPLPGEPDDAPCPGHIANDRLAWSVPAADASERLGLVSDRECGHYLIAQLAAEAINAGRSLEPFERWAFHFDAWRVWPEHRRAFSVVALVVAGVLSRSGYYPEAEVVLGASDLFAARSLQHYQAVGLAHLGLVRGRDEDIKDLVEALLETQAPEDVKALAGLVAMLSETLRGSTSNALSMARSTWASLDDPEAFGGPLSAFAGEVALAGRDGATAKTWFTRAAESRHPRARRAGQLRLADFAAQAGRFRRAKRILARVRPETPCDEALVELREKVMSLGEADAVLRLLENTVKEPSCPAELREARFALAQTYVQVGLPELAIPLAWTLESELPVEYRSIYTPLPMLERAFREAAARLARHERWQDLTLLYEGHVAEKAAMELLDGLTLVHIARAYIESGAPQSGSTVLTMRFAKGVSDESRLSVVLSLVNTYLAANDTYRANLVLDYFEKTFGPATRFWLSLNRGRLAMLNGEPGAALEELEGVETPAGDPTFIKLELQARAHLALEEPILAAQRYLEAVGLPNAAQPEHPEDVVRVLSACARAEIDGPCGALFRAVHRSIPLSHRLEAHAIRLGWQPSDQPSPSMTAAGLAEMLVQSTANEPQEKTQ